MTKAKARSAGRAATIMQTTVVSPEERQRMIAEAAYYRALARGFAGGDPLEDWLAAEAEVDRALARRHQQ